MLVSRNPGSDAVVDLLRESGIMGPLEAQSNDLQRVLVMAIKRALFHPVAAAFLAVSLLLALFMAAAPALDRYSGRVAWMLLLGGATYAAVVYVLRTAKPGYNAPE